MDEPSSLDVPRDTKSPLEDSDREVRSLSITDIIIRVGAGICLIGFVIAIVGAQQIAAQRIAVPDVAQIIHRVGLLTLLIGFVVLLAGYRASWVKATSDRNN
ncbi:MAG: hypothetical protein ACYC6N_14155 [Pirellulaceae bacterium]